MAVRSLECLHNIQPIVLRDAANDAWNLTLAFYSLDPPFQAINTAQIVAVPEPASYALLVGGLGLLGLVRRRAGGLTQLVPATDGDEMEDRETPECISDAERLRDSFIDISVLALLDAAAEALRDHGESRSPPVDRT